MFVYVVSPLIPPLAVVSEIQEIISEVKNTVENGSSDFFEEVNYGKNPTPVYKH